jgi:hypothetical protein
VGGLNLIDKRNHGQPENLCFQFVDGGKFFDNLVEMDFAPVAVHLDWLAGH